MESPLIVVPAFNEQETIECVVTSLHNLNYEVLVVDDCSCDATAELAARSGAHVLHLSVNLGVGGALRAGFRFAIGKGYSTVVQVDADGQHPDDQVADLLKALYQFDAHLVIGSRYLPDSSTFLTSRFRRFAMWCLSSVASQLARTRITDSTSGFRAIRQPLLSEFAREFPNYYLGDTFESTVAAARAGYKVIEIPASIRQRAFGKSSIGSIRAVQLIAKVLIVSIASLQVRIRPLRQHSSDANPK